MTLLQFAVVEWADNVGKGFAPYRTADSPVPTEYWLAAQSLLESDIVAQPPVRSTAPHPVWSLQFVELGRLGGHWCFAVQGRGDDFGVAGTCRFLFADGKEHPFDVWTAGVTAEGGMNAAPVDDEALRTALEAVVLEVPRIKVPGTPADLAAIVSHLLRVLPPRVVARRAWLTCLLQRPDTQRAILSGDLPEDYRRAVPGVARSIDQIRWSPPPDREKLTGGRRSEAFAWLLDAARLDQPDELILRSETANCYELLGEIARSKLDITVDQVPGLLTSAGGRQRLLERQDLVMTWARTKPDAAADQFDLIKDPALRVAAIEGLIRASPSAGHGWAMPVTDQWATRLRHRPGDPASAVRTMKDHNDRFASQLDQPDGRKWLRSLGMSPWEHRDFFPNRVAALVDEITMCRGLSSEVLQELRNSHEHGKPDLALQVAQELPALDPELAARFVVNSPDFRQPSDADAFGRVQDLAEQLTATSTSSTKKSDVSKAEQWLESMLRSVINIVPDPTGAALRAVMYGGLQALLLPGVRRGATLVIRDKTLQSVCHRIGVDSRAPHAVHDLLPALEERLSPLVPSVTAGRVTGVATPYVVASDDDFGQDSFGVPTRVGGPPRPGTASAKPVALSARTRLAHQDSGGYVRVFRWIAVGAAVTVLGGGIAGGLVFGQPAVKPTPVASVKPTGSRPDGSSSFASTAGDPVTGGAVPQEERTSIFSIYLDGPLENHRTAAKNIANTVGSPDLTQGRRVLGVLITAVTDDQSRGMSTASDLADLVRQAKPAGVGPGTAITPNTRLLTPSDQPNQVDIVVTFAPR